MTTNDTAPGWLTNHEADVARGRIIDAARSVRAGREDLEAQERRVRLELGVLAVAAEATIGQDGKPVVDRRRLAEEAGYSPPSVYKFAADVVASPGWNLTRVTNSELAQMHLGYGFAGHEAVAEEFWSRYPALRGWYNAASWVRRQAEEQWWEGRDEEWTPMTGEQSPTPDAYREMMAEYQVMVERIAGGPLAADLT